MDGTQIDTVHWFSGLEYPRSVVANGNIYMWNDGRTNYDTMTAVFDYGHGKKKNRVRISGNLFFSSNKLFGGYQGVVFF